jgi:pimeloyl-ACP methyl ester carboxylesterase
MPSRAARDVAVVLVSAGVTPKFGPFRLYAELARELAAGGSIALRFDLGGIGDSASVYDGRTLEERTEMQIRAALDLLEQSYGVTKVVLAGLCSGAEDSFRHAERDERVTRVVMIDPFAYRTFGFSWRYLRFRARRRLLRALGLYRAAPRRQAPALVDYEHLPQPEARRILQGLLARRVSMHFIYTAGMHEHFNYAGQLRAMFRGISFDGLVRVDHLPRLDHTQLLEADRRKLIEVVTSALASAR